MFRKYVILRGILSSDFIITYRLYKKNVLFQSHSVVVIGTKRQLRNGGYIA